MQTKCVILAADTGSLGLMRREAPRMNDVWTLTMKWVRRGVVEVADAMDRWRDAPCMLG